MKPKFISGKGHVQRALATLLALTMMFSGSVSAFAIDGRSLGGEPPSMTDGTEDQLISGGGLGTISGGLDEDSVNNIPTVPPDPIFSNSDDSGDLSQEDIGNSEDRRPSSDRINDSHRGDNKEDVSMEGDSSDDPYSSPSVPDEKPYSDSEEMSFMEQLYNLDWSDENGNKITLLPPGMELFAAAGDTGTLVTRGIPVNDFGFYVSGGSGRYACIGDLIYSMSVNGEQTFCIQPWYLAYGTYEASEQVMAEAAGKEAALIQIYSNWQESPKTDAYYAAAQVLVWETLFSGADFYGHMISGTNVTASFPDISPITGKPYDPMGIVNGEKHVTDASARIAAYNDLKNAHASTEGLSLAFWQGAEGSQALISLFTGEHEEIPPTDTDTPGEGGGEDDAFGEIVIIKKDENGKSLDGARFRVDVKFATGKVHNHEIEVKDGSASYRYEHPKGDTKPATVTVTEVSAPPGYVLDSTPVTHIVTPTYIDGDKLHEGHVQEFSFVNIPAQIMLTIYKHQKGNSSIALEGASFTVAYTDPSIYGGTWEVTTGPDGKAIIALPKPGTILITETEAPENYKIIDPETTVAIQWGETEKTVNIANDKHGSLIIKKRDVDDGRLLPGATFLVRKIGNGGDDTGEGAGYSREVTTGPDGTVLVEGLEPGAYHVEEINPPPYYVLDVNPVKNVEVLEGSHEPVEVVFYNEAYTGLRIIKVDKQNPSKSLAGAVFEVYRGNGIQDGAPTGDLVGQYVTPESGIVVVNPLKPGFYTIFERTPPDGYILDEVRYRIVEVKDENIDDMLNVVFQNMPKPKLKIVKVDKETGKRLEGAVFKLRKSDGSEINGYDSPQGSPGSSLFTTDANGEIFIEKLDEGFYTIEEIRAPNGYLLPVDPISEPFQLVAGKTTELVMTNSVEPSLIIEKVDKDTRVPLPGAVFKLTKEGASEYTHVTTGPDGKAVIKGLAAGWYIIEEVTAPTGYLPETGPYHVELKPDEDVVITITNTKISSLSIRKVDAKTNAPLANAEFGVYTPNGSLVYHGITDKDGWLILYPMEPGDYVVKELKAPNGYTMDKKEVNVTIRPGEDIEIVMENSAIEPLYIQKIDSKTGKPLDGAVFKVEKTGGKFVGEYTTGITGYATVTGLTPGYYVVTEIKAPNGYSLSSSPKTVELKAGQPASVVFENDQLRGIQLLKVNEKTGEPLTGVTFKITKANGEFIGQYKTDENGLVTISGLEPGAYTIVEIATIEGYILDNTPKTVTLEENNPTVVTVEIKNKPLAGLQIRKIDGSTNEPLAGVEFEVKSADGKLIGKYTTSETGIIFIENLKPGAYVVTELTTLQNYTIDAQPRTVTVKSGELHTEVFKNYEYPVLTLKKVDSETGQPLAGAKFKLMDSSYRELGVTTTSEMGLVNLTGLSEGIYYVQEIQAPTGYVLDSTVRQVSLQWGKTTVLELKNTAKGSLRIQKVDSVTGKPLYNATFNIYDSKNNLLGEYTTDNTGMIIFSSQITAGKYILKEVKAPDGYVLDSTPITIYVKGGETTEITIKNTPETGNIRIVKVAADDNSITKDKKGATLAGAVFEIYNESGDVVDRITTGEDGVAKSKDLPLGKYAIKEITPPKHYTTDGKPFYAEIKVANDLIKFKVENAPTDISTTVQKRGNVEVLPGDTMTWEFYDIKNTSTVALDEFYWHDLIPTDSVRAISFTTGVWSERVNMTAYYRTNLTSNYRVLKDNLLSTTNHELALTSSALGLKPNEYVTDVKLVFGTVQAGFHETTRPTLTAYVLPNLIDGYSIVNRTDVGGREDEEWVYCKDSWVTITIRLIRGFLPQTGFGLKNE